jgi:hypothetical protein
MVYLGRISYGTYLWHGLVILVATRAFHPSPRSTAAIACLVATGLASVSYQLLEQPIRRSPLLDRHRIVVIATGLAISLVCGLVIVPRILDKGSGSGAIALSPQQIAGSDSTKVPRLDWAALSRDIFPFPSCLGAAASQCTVVHGSGKRVALVGDSAAEMLLPAFIELAHRENLTLSATVAPLCIWQQGLRIFRSAAAGNALIRRCKTLQADWYQRVLPALHPDLVVLMDRPIDDPNGTQDLITADGAILSIQRDRARFETALQAASQQTITAFRRSGTKVLLIEPIPVASTSFDPISCLSSNTSTDACRYVVTPGPTPIERFYRSIATRDNGVWSLDMDRLVCPYLPICDPILHGTVVKRDFAHLTTGYARSLAGDIDAYLTRSNILAGRP